MFRACNRGSVDNCFYTIYEDEEDGDIIARRLEPILLDSVQNDDQFGFRVTPNLLESGQSYRAIREAKPIVHPRTKQFLGHGLDIALLVSGMHADHRALGDDYTKIREYISNTMKETALNIPTLLRLYTLQPMVEEPMLRIWMNFRRFRCMDAMYWLQPFPSPFTLDFFGNLLWDAKFMNHEDKLGQLMQNYTSYGKFVLANIFLHGLVMTCGCFSFMSEHDSKLLADNDAILNQEAAAAFLDRMKQHFEVYISDRWNTTDMPSQMGLSTDNLFSLMGQYSEVFKTSTAILRRVYKLVLYDEGQQLPLDIICGDAVVKYMHVIYMHVLRLMISHIFITTEPYITENDFVNVFAPLMQRLIAKCVNETYSSLPEMEKHYGIEVPYIYDQVLPPRLSEEFIRTSLSNTIVSLRLGHPLVGDEAKLNNQLFTVQWCQGITGSRNDASQHKFRTTYPLLKTENAFWEIATLLPVGDDFQIPGATQPHGYVHPDCENDYDRVLIESTEILPANQAPPAYDPNNDQHKPNPYFHYNNQYRKRVYPYVSVKFQQLHYGDFPLLLRLRQKRPDGTTRVTPLRGSEALFTPTQYASDNILTGVIFSSRFTPACDPQAELILPRWWSVKKSWDVKNPHLLGGGHFIDIFDTNDLETIFEDPESIEVNHDETRELVDYTAQEEDYQNDIEDSDNEFDCLDEVERLRDTNYAFLNNPDDIEAFYTEVLSWLVNPDDTHADEHINAGHEKNRAWIESRKESVTDKILNNPTHAETLDMYGKHIAALSVLTVRANVQAALEDPKFEVMTKYPINFMDDLHYQDYEATGLEFIEMEVGGVSATEHLLHFEATSNNEELNRYIIEDCLMGLTLCVAQFERGRGTRSCPIPPGVSRRDRNRSNLIFVLIRRVAVMHLEAEDDEVQMDPADAAIRQLRVRMSVSREVLKHQGFALQDRHSIHFTPVCSLASEFRVLKALPRLRQLPDAFNRRLYGSNIPAVQYSATNVTAPPSNNTVTAIAAASASNPPTEPDAVRAMIEAQTDVGVRNYLLRCLHNPDCLVDASHFNALIQMARVLGDANPGDSGMCMTQGPPGTGKTETVVHLLGSLLHHSQYGHMVHRNQQVTHQRTPRSGPRRRNRNKNALRILVVASSNSAVDNIMERIHNRGIPDGNGGVIRPAMCRILRHDFNPPVCLRQYTIRGLAANRDADGRANPSLRAKREAANECILFFSTSSSTGSSQLKELNQAFDIVVHDEAANSLEPETLVALVAASTHQELSLDRLFYFGVGDEIQLPALSLVPSMLASAKMATKLQFDFKTLNRSLFERLIYNNRTMFAFLDAQFRMHSSISLTTTPPFYNLYFRCPVPDATFLAVYNQPSVHWGFYPMTFIDTSSIPDRFEVQRDSGFITNSCEAEIINHIVNELLTRYGDVLNDQIAIIAPYRSQVAHITTVLQMQCPALRGNGEWDRRNIMVTTVDAMQGRERDVVIVSVTRSNKSGLVGFVRENRRLNVSVSRARRLNIVIGDYSTICTMKAADDIRTRQFTRPSRFSSAPRRQSRFSQAGPSSSHPPPIAGPSSSTLPSRIRSPDKGIKSLEKMYTTCATHRHDGARLARVTRIRVNQPGQVEEIPTFHVQYLDRQTPRTTRNNSAAQGEAENMAVVNFTPTVSFATLYPPTN